jgi:hypothetical protein
MWDVSGSKWKALQKQKTASKRKRTTTFDAR